MQSWYVHAPTAITAPAIDVSPGDEITSFMSYDSKSETWTVSATNLATGEDSTLTITKQKLGNYDFDWAMLVCETIKKDGECASLPADAARARVLLVTASARAEGGLFRRASPSPTSHSTAAPYRGRSARV